MKKIKSLKDIKGVRKNPFTVELKGKMFLQPRANTIIARGQEIVDTTTGETLEDDVLLGRRKVVDKSQFAKIYANEMGALFSLSRPAINVFLHLTKVMDYENKAIFDYKKDYEEIGYKAEVSPLKGIRELIGKNIIYPHYINGLWWINPSIVCKGERFAKYTEYVTEERHERDMCEMKKAEQKRILKEQGKQYFEMMNKETDGKLQRSLDAYEVATADQQRESDEWNEMSEIRKGERAYEKTRGHKDIFSGEFVKEQESYE